MKRFSIMALGMVLAMMATGAHNGASAQIIAPGITPPMMPPPPSPPPPKIEVPAVPQFDAPVRQPKVRRSQRGSFGDRVIDCLHQGAGAGLNSGDRAAYSRACANQ
ncbi:MAG: hypothetical protein WBA48_07650 [Xanthobacteraceae bacterium]